jgi:hypothetical protein
MKTLLKTIVLLLLSLLFIHCKPEPIEPIHYIDYNPDICLDFDDTAGLKKTYIDLFEDNINDIFVRDYHGPSAQMTCLNNNSYICCGQRLNSQLEPILANVGIGNQINDRDWTKVLDGNISAMPTNTDFFIALKFIKKDGVHYGWMRVRHDWRFAEFIIKDYAIHNTAEATILTGQKEKE